MQTENRVHISDIDDLIQQLKDTLKQFRKGQNPNEIWLNTYLLANYTTPNEAHQQLHKILKEIIVRELRQARQTVGIRQPDNLITKNSFQLQDVYTTHAQLKKQLKLDMGDDSYPQLRQWSTLYHLYFVTSHISTTWIAEQIFRAPRQVRNYRQDGIKRLAEMLVLREEEYIQDLQTQHDFKPKTFSERKAYNLIESARLARGMDNEAEALDYCEVAITYTLDNKLPRYYIMAVAVKIFTMLQGGEKNIRSAKQFLKEAENNPVMQHIDLRVDKWWCQTKIHSMWAHLWRRSGNLTKAREAAQKAVNYVGRLAFTDKELAKDTYLIYGIMCWASGLYEKAHDVLTIALESGYDNVYDVHEMLGLTCWSQARYNDAEHHFNLAIDQTTQQEDKWHLGNQLGNLGLVYLLRGQLEKSEEYIESHWQIATTLESWKEQHRATANLGLVLMHRRQYEDAYPLLTEAYETYQTMSAPMSHLLTTITLSQFYTLTKDHDKALDLAQIAYQIASEFEKVYIPRLVTYRCLAGCKKINIPKRITYLKKAIELAEPYRPFDVVASQLALAYLQEDATLKQHAQTTLQKLGVRHWLTQFKETYPHLPILT